MAEPAAPSRPAGARRPAPTRRTARRRPRTLREKVVRAAKVVGGVLLGLFLLAVLERVVYAGEVLPGVELEGIVTVGAKGDADALAEIDALAADLETAPIEARAGDVDLVADVSTVDLEIDEVATLRSVRRAGRSRNPLDQTFGMVLRRFRPERVELAVTYDERGLAGVLDSWVRQTSEGVVEGDLRFEGAEVVPVMPEAGTGILRADARERLDAMLRSGEREVVRLPTGRLEPTIDESAVEQVAAEARELLAADITIVTDGVTITLPPERLAATLGTKADDSRLRLTLAPDRLGEALGDDVARLSVAPVDAGFVVAPDGSVSVVPSTSGKELDLAAVSKKILAGERRITAPLRETEPERDTEWAQSLGIKELVSEFTTQHPAGQARVTNIHRAADIVDNTVVEPGEVFSLNDTVGARTAERGFVLAPVIYGDFSEDFGGGVSQLATTMFNAVFFGGYEDVSHRPHTIYISRYPMGREATVNYPTLDLKFRNDSEHGILIRTSYTSSSITVQFYGDKEGKVVTAEGPNVLATRPIETEYIDWPLLPFGEEDEIEHGYTGYDVENFRIIERPGREPERQRFFWRYRMMPRKVLRGTMVPETTAVPSTSVPAETTTTSVPAPTTTTSGP